jgi:renalase
MRPSEVRQIGCDLSGPFDAVMIALPAAQAASLLGTAVHAFGEAAGQAVLAPCWAVMAHFPSYDLTKPDVVQTEDSPVSWAAREGSRPGHSQEPNIWTLHASAAWSRAHLDDEAGAVGQMLVHEFRALTSAPPGDTIQAHRWRYALAETSLGVPCLWDPKARLGVCGDWCLGRRIEAAYDSGIDLARTVLEG